MALKFLNSSAKFFLLNSFRIFLPCYNLKPPILHPALNLPFARTYSSNDDDQNKSKSNEKAFRHCYSDELEGAVNHQILSELNASMVYLSMFCYYGRTDIALPGCQSFFKAMYDEEQEHALKFIDYQLLRGGEVKLFPLTVPEDSNWTDITIALGVSLELEKRVKEQLEKLVRLAECHRDLQLADFITAEFLKDQNESICEMGRLLTKAKRLVSNGIGRHLFDKEISEYVHQKNPEIKLPFKNI